MLINFLRVRCENAVNIQYTSVARGIFNFLKIPAENVEFDTPYRAFLRLATQAVTDKNILKKIQRA